MLLINMLDLSVSGALSRAFPEILHTKISILECIIPTNLSPQSFMKVDMNFQESSLFILKFKFRYTLENSGRSVSKYGFDIALSNVFIVHVFI